MLALCLRKYASLTVGRCLGQLGCQNKIPQTFIFSQVWSLEVQTQGASRVGVSSWVADGRLLVVCVPMAFPPHMQVERERTSFLGYLFMRPPSCQIRTPPL